MAITNLNVNEKEKTKEWLEKAIMSIRENISSTVYAMEKDILCWKMYHNTWEDHKYDYLRKYGDNYLPSQVRRIPLQKHFIKLLVSQEARRPFNFSVSAIDESANEEKIMRKVRKNLDKVLSVITRESKKRANDLLEMENQLSSYRQELEQVKPTTEEEVQQFRDAVAKLAEFEIIVIQNREHIKIQDMFDQQDIDDIKTVMNYNDKDLNEERAQLLLVHLVEKLRVRDKKRYGFEDKCVTGKEFYFVDAIPGSKHPVFEYINSMMVYYPAIDDVKFVQHGPWVAIKDVISYDQISASYGTEIEKKYGKEALTDLQENPLYESNSVFLATPEGALLSDQQTYSGNKDSGQKYERVRVFFKSQRKVAKKISPNPYSDVAFQHTLDPYKEYIEKSDYHYKNGYYVNKNDKKIVYSPDQVIVYSKKKGEDIIYKYTNDIYEGTIIAGKYIVCEGKKKNIIRDPYRHSEVLLPVFGRTYSGANEAPSSIVWDTKDIDELYKITLYHMELAMALSGTKTTIIDRSQRPTTLTDQEWEYQKKIGNLFIETVDANGRQKNMAFNQWQMFDNSLSASVQYFQPVLEMLYSIMGTIIGIPRPREGQVVATDQVGTSQMAMQQSSLITEIMYEEHDEILKQAEEYLVNIAVKYNYKDGYSFETRNPSDNRSKQIIIPKDELAKHVFSILVESSSKDERNLDDLKQVAIGQYSKAMLPFRELVGLYSVDSVKQLEKRLDYFNSKAEELNSMRQSEQINNQLEYEQKLQQFKTEHDKEMAAIKDRADQMKLQLESAKLQMEQTLKSRELDIKENEIAVDANLRMMEMQLEDKTETAMLMENRDARVTANKLDLFNMKMDGVLKDKKIEADRSSKEKGNKMPEHLNDN